MVIPPSASRVSRTAFSASSSSERARVVRSSCINPDADSVLDSSISPRSSSTRGRSSAFVGPLKVGIPVASSTGVTSPLTMPGRRIMS